MNRRQSPTIDELDGGGFRLLAAMTHAELAPFVLDYFLKRTSWVIWLHHAMTLVIFGLTVFLAIEGGVSFVHAVAVFALAFAAMFVVLLPLHEGIHAVAYWLVGSRDIRWGYSLRFLAFWVTAHRFVCGRWQFVFVALAPFVVLHGALIAAAILAGAAKWTVFYLCLLLWHHQGVSGDWSLLNFVWLHRREGFWTWDDSESGQSFFYGRAADADRNSP